MSLVSMVTWRYWPKGDESMGTITAKLNRLILMAACVTSALTALAHSFVGSWNGQIDLCVTKLRIVINVSVDGSCTFVSPDQSAKEIPAKFKTTKVDTMEVSVPSIGAKFVGRLKDGTVKGTFTQRGMKFPLELKPGEVVLNRPQNPCLPFPYSTAEVVFTNASAKAVLAGTLSLPADAKCVALMVTGSGLQDRDEQMYGHRPFAVIADHLARKGIATLRYDDRGTAKSKGGSLKSATTRDFSMDAEAGLAYLRGLGQFTKVGIIGHSEGGSIAYMLGARGKVDFIVSLAGPAVKGDVLLFEQSRALLGDAAKNLTLEQVRKAPATKGNAWHRFFIDYDPQKDIRKVSCPVLALNGEKDKQVVAQPNVTALRRVLPSNTLSDIKTYPKLNHLFQHCETGLAREYGEIEETISEEVLKDIADWINRVMGDISDK